MNEHTIQPEYEVKFPVDIDQFKKQIENRTRMFKYNRQFSDKLLTRVAAASAILGALGTIAIGLSGTIEGWSKIFSSVALVFTASTTALQAWSGFFGHRQSHIFYADGASRLWEIRRDLEHVEQMADGDKKGEAVASLYARFQDLLRALHEQWKQQQIQGGEGEKKGA